jgi:uncharacterized membrane protein (DUF373 family)
MPVLTNMDILIARAQRLIVCAMIMMLIIVIVLSTVHLGVLVAYEVWQPPRFLISVHGLLEVFSYFLLVLIGVELLETLKGYIDHEIIRVRVVLEVALIAMARKTITEEPKALSSTTLFGIAALILALGAAFYFEREARN